MGVSWLARRSGWAVWEKRASGNKPITISYGLFLRTTRIVMVLGSHTASRQLRAIARTCDMGIISLFNMNCHLDRSEA
jgi:hypothetical protein